MATQMKSLNLKERVEAKYSELPTVNGVRVYPLSDNVSYAIDAENLVILPIWNIMVNHSLDNLSVDTSITQPPKKTLAILIEQLKNNSNGEYFGKFRQGKAVPVAYIYDTVTKKDVMVYAHSGAKLSLVNRHKNTTTNLIIPVSINYGNGIKVEGNIVEDQANTQALIKKLPYKIEKYDVNDAIATKFDFDTLQDLL